VYRARDTRLGRDVAIKVVSEALGADEAFVERFEREARLAASLNHPNVVTLHDIGFHDGKPYFITELLLGNSLRERLAGEPVPVSIALGWAAQMAQGLAAAHEHGIIHRDLKPENVFVTQDGHIKLLDFGIAKLVEAVQAPLPHGLMDDTVSPSGRRTGTGMVLGTPGYMSPEQVRGDVVDARTDIFSFGAVLYEMLAWRPAFAVGHMVERAYAILHAEPEPLPPAVPAPVAEVVHRCLEKEPSRRLQSARELSQSLESARTESSGLLRSAGRTRPPNSALPRSFTALVGREQEVRALTTALASSPLVTITGPGGTGKTRVAIAVAEAVPPELARRVAFVDLAAIGEAGLLPRAAATALQLRDLPGGASVTDAIVNALRDESVLVLLDNCEHLVEASAAFAAAMVAGCEGVRVLATSQLPLRVKGESVFRLEPLTSPPDLTAPSAETLATWPARYPALELLVQRLTAVDPGFELTPSLAPAAAEICRRLDGLPLALELVAPRTQVLSLREIADQLRHRFQLLSKGDRSLPSRQQGLTAVLEWSYGLLSRVEQRAVERLSVFAGTFAHPAFVAVCAPLSEDRLTLVDLLQGLVEKSFVIAQRAEEGGRRFRLLETVRQYALLRLTGSGEEEDTLARLLEWAIELAEGEGRHSQGWYRRVTVEYDNVRVAFEFSQRNAKSGADGLRLTAGLWLYWMRGDFSEFSTWLERSLAAAPHAATATRAEGLVALAHFRAHAQVPGVRAAAEVGLQLALELGHERLAALARVGLTWAEIHDRRLDAATALAEQALHSARGSGSPWVLAYTLHARSVCALLSGDQPLALSSIREAFGLADESMPALLRVYLQLNLGLYEYANRESGAARRTWRCVLDDSLSFLNRRTTAGVLEGAAYLAADRSSWSEAARLLGAAARIREITGAPLLPHWAAVHAPVEARIRSALDADFEKEHHAGATLPFEEAKALGHSALA